MNYVLMSVHPFNAIAREINTVYFNACASSQCNSKRQEVVLKIFMCIC